MQRLRLQLLDLTDKLSAAFGQVDTLHLVSRECQRAIQAGAPACTGYCYIASEVVYHALGGSLAGLTPVSLRHEGRSHWYLRTSEGEYVDVTAGQFETPVPWEKGVGRGFLTSSPSKNARELARKAGIILETKVEEEE